MLSVSSPSHCIVNFLNYFEPVSRNNIMESLMAQMEGMALGARGANGAGGVPAEMPGAG